MFRFTNLKPGRLLSFGLLAATILCSGFILNTCSAGGGAPHPATGVTKKELDDGSTRYAFTARASLNAREKGSGTMMRATSRDAARLLFKNEFQQNDLNESKFKITGWVFLRRGEYCRLNGIYYPSGIPKTRRK